ncbi:TetR/AcrR family transcriptional regulator [Vibrio hepatarius]|jgi:TetR/AcrR family transcriptional regulator of autoinduction and epiphytic fitness|uniref:TetR family transcriptional regulator n=2 Tax=Vibrio hepatarius TaxID=171383 RepID=A0A0M0I3P5_9VIBR|nr:TetR/AcrR family transcriptional regulator [Vibrio hepatarius]KOO08543.1 TetR family transcriptional regulator [Vibrio hepatarius]
MMEKKQSRSELKREAIVEAAIEAFREEGVKATSMDRLAKLANVSKRTIYNHFENKEALVLHLLSELWQRAIMQSEVSYNRGQPLESQLAVLLTEELEFLSSPQYQDLARVAFDYLFSNPDMLQDELKKLSEKETAVYRWIVAARDDGKLIELDADIAKEQLHSLIKGSALWPQLMRLREPLTIDEKQRLVEETTKLFLARYQKS